MATKTKTVGSKVVICHLCSDIDGKAKRISRWVCDACKKDLSEVRKGARMLKLTPKVREALVNAVMEVRIAYRAAFEELQDALRSWERLWCDQPEDRLYHAKDRTWWTRVHDPEKKKALVAVYGRFTEYSPYSAEPPPEIMTIVRAARKVKKKDAKLKDALLGFERYE